MDENSIITQCPVCLTQFRVTAGQLKIASGQVRCGACLHVFNAPKNSLSISLKQTNKEQDAPPRKSVAEQTHKPEPATTNPVKTPNPAIAPSAEEPGIHPATETNIPSLRDSIEAEAVILDAPGISPRPFPLTWFLACLLALILLGLQLFWFKRTEIYWAYPQIQSAYEIACQHLPCNIPPQQALELIQNQRILITPSPDYEDVVDLNLILFNGADFAQPYPALQLQFSDLKGRLVAQRIIQPQEYLQSDTQELQLMPIKQPLQITLGILSPGARAVNYQLDLLAPRL